MPNDDEHEPPTAQWLLDLGITDRASGIEKATQSRDLLDKTAMAALRSRGTLTTALLLVMGLTTRGQGLHVAAVDAVKADNPYAAFTLIRAYAENAAAALYAIEKPAKAEKLLGLDGGPVSIGQLTSHANQGSKRFAEFRQVYSELSSYAHPTSKSLFAANKAVGDREIRWRSKPAFKFEGDCLTACGWIVEMAEANASLIAELGHG